MTTTTTTNARRALGPLLGAALLALLACDAGDAATTCPEPPLAAAEPAVEAASEAAAVDPLPSWSDGPSKQAILAFTAAVTDEGGPEFVPPGQRIAVFDNDGTLWIEQPIYAQLAFALDRVRALAAEHPEWTRKQPFKAVLDGDLATVAKGGHEALFELVLATHSGLTTDEFAAVVSEWLASAEHPKLGRPYTELVYAPMVELLDHLRANGFEIYIVSGGGVEFMRVFAEAVYGVPPEHVIGSEIATEYQVRDGAPVIVRKPALLSINDEAGKAVNIQRAIGRRPILAVGNSDGDLEMIEWTTAGAGRRLGLLLHHTDAEREVAYDRESSVGRLDEALELAPERGWVVIDMQREWTRVFAGASGQ